jgi:MYXO-CTERM domain-containing protein
MAGLATVAFSSAPARAGVDRPPPLQGEAGCVTYSGQATGGNDATVRLEVRLCRGTGDTLTGVTQWSSLVSGWSERRIGGRIDRDSPGRIVLEDLEFLEYKPEPDWRFCLIDEYDLKVEASALTGTYVSKDCNDTAALALELTSGDPSALLGPAGTAAPPTSPADRGGSGASAPLPDAPRERETTPPLTPRSTSPDGDRGAQGGCACATASAPDETPTTALLAATLALLSLPRRRASHEKRGRPHGHP